ncbi:amino acid adenylation domain-containing protein [Streptomyces huasconensis]|uniref:amino acid adenylation domain-containing protein n=1 Tax=Streptomyces huasconensis TaxID=1854574 RepID=UPI0033D88BC6
MTDSVINRFVRHAEQNPEAPAVYWRQGGLTYRELLDRVEVLAAALREHGSEGPVALHLSRTPKLIAALLASWYSGRAFVALDPRHPPRRQQAILAESRPAVLVYDDPLTFDVPGLPQWDIRDLGTAAVSRTATPVEPAEDTAYLLYTSGSTGKPKGIAIAHRSVRALMDWAQEYYEPDQLRCVLASTTITFDLAVFEIFVPLVTGQAIWLVESVLDLLDEEAGSAAPTLINTVPSAARELVRARAIPTSVNTVNLAGEALNWRLVDDIYESSRVNTVNNLWGPSEDTTYSTAFRSRRTDERPGSGPVPIGFPVSGTEVFVVDEQLRTVAPGQKGEILLAGVGLAEGYHDNPELTAERFPRFTGPDGEERRVYRTGDWGHRDPSGLLHFHGRIDFQVKIRGHRIELEELEQALLTLDAVREAAVIVQSRQEEHKLLAIVTKSRHDQSDDELVGQCRQHLQRTLPAYMMPHGLQVRAAALPRTTSGKIDRRALSADHEVRQDQAVPSSPVMALVAETLGRVPEADDTFLSLGGDSLAAVRLRTLLRDRAGKSVDVRSILSATEPLSALVRRIEELPDNVAKADAVPLKDGRLSALEYRMVKVYKTHRSPGSYNIGLVVRFDGVVETDRMHRAIMTVLAQSRSLASTVELDRDGAHYRPADMSGIWCELPAEECDEGRQREFFARPFALEQEPPVRALLLTQRDGCSRLLLSFAHTAVDGVGLNALLRDISSVYRGDARPPSVKPRFTTASDARTWEAVRHWQHELGGYGAEHPWPQSLEHAPDGVVSWTVDAEVRERLAVASRDHGLTLPVMLMATLFVALQRVSGSRDLVIATPVANREGAGAQSVVANMTNSLPVRCVLHEGSTVREAVTQVHRQLADGLQWQDVAIDEVVDRLSDEVAKEALFDIIFSYMDFLPDDLGLPDVPARVDLCHTGSAKAPLVVSAIVTADDGLRLMFEYQGDRVPADWVTTISDMYGHLLEQRSVLDGGTLDRLDPVPPAQLPVLRELLTPRPVETAASLVDWLSDSVARFGPRVALQDGDVSVTYARLWRESEDLAAGLQAHGVRAGDAIGVHMVKGWRLVAALLAVLRAGAFYVPLDPRNPTERNLYIAQHSRIRFAVTDSDEAAGFPTESYKALARSGDGFTPVPVAAHDLAYVIFTSGTTGRPKGVTISHHNVCRLFSACAAWGQFDENDRWTLFHSYAFDFSVWEIFGPLLYGGCAVMVHHAEATNMLRFAELLERERISVVSLTPTAFRNFTSATDAALSELPRLVVFGGEELHPSDLQPWWRRHGTQATRLVNMYGITEVTVHATAHEMTPEDTTSCIGTPLADTGILLRDARGLPCPIGVPGEMCITGDGVSLGYYDAPELNEQRFGFLSAQGVERRYYFSGDVAVVDRTGRLRYLGRQDSQVKVNGHRVELDEVTGALRQAPGVTAAVVRAVAIDSDARMLVAWYVSDRDVQPQELAEQVSRVLPAWAVPERLLPVPVLPMTVNGKIDTSRLPDPLQADAAPQPSGEHPVHEIWREILGAGQLPEDLPFFEAGGSSIKAALLVQRLNSLLREPAVSLVDVFRHPCIQDQKEMLDELLRAERT